MKFHTYGIHHQNNWVVAVSTSNYDYEVNKVRKFMIRRHMNPDQRDAAKMYLKGYGIRWYTNHLGKEVLALPWQIRRGGLINRVIPFKYEFEVRQRVIDAATE